MEISENGRQVNFYAKNTGNNINTAAGSEYIKYQSNIFAPETALMGGNEKITVPKPRRKRKNKRLNTIDTDYIPYDAENTGADEKSSSNFFIESGKNGLKQRVKNAYKYFISNIPLVNYFFLKQKEQQIAKTVKSLTDISGNVDELLNTMPPYGEEDLIYQSMAKNLNDAANIIGKANKNI